MGASARKQRRRAALAGAVVAMAVLGAACGPVGVGEDPPPDGCPGGPPDPVASTVYNRTNADRGAEGLGGLDWNARLACLSMEWSGVMARNGAMAHRNLADVINSPGFGSYSGLAENVFVGPASADGDMIHNAWMGSPSHHANIMGSYDSMGFGWATSGDGRLFATENFGRHK